MKKLREVEDGQIDLSAKAQEWFDGCSAGYLWTDGNGNYYVGYEKSFVEYIGSAEDVNTAFETYQQEMDASMDEWNFEDDNEPAEEQ